MNLNNIYNFNNQQGISDIYAFSGSCGIYDGFDSVTEKTADGFTAVREAFTVLSEIKSDDGVFMRTDTVRNTSGSAISINHYAYRFAFEGGEFDVYTQLSHWQNESSGEWQKLVTEVGASSKGIYTTATSTPMAAVWDRQTGRGVVFHILPECSWKINVSRKNAVSKNVFTVVEISLKDDGLKLELEKDESINFSPVIYYEFTDRESLDCHKLHKFFNKLYPRREMPVMYNTWLAFFDRVDFESVSAQAVEAADMGCEYFVLDAGWFGEGDASWVKLIGQWTENRTGAYKGRMKELSDKVHRLGMKFGLWLEPERAKDGAGIVHEHPEYFIKGAKSYFLDFANDEARAYMTKVTLELIKKYNIDYIKFDFNDNLSYDIRRTAFYKYHKGYYRYIDTIKEKYPDIYLECCAGGGFRMDLGKLRRFDSFWFSDNQSPYEGLKIVKNTIKRMPPSALDRWAVLVSRDGFIPAYDTNETVRTLATDNGTWDAVIGVTPEFITGFFRGGTPALSCDLTKFDSRLKKQIKDFISKYKEERGFWKDASCRILCDTESLLVLQYENGGEIRIVIYTFRTTQAGITVYPVIEKESYLVDGVERSCEDIIMNGIHITDPKDNFSYTIPLSLR